MARLYGDLVEVQTGEDGRPARFVWRSKVYTVRSVQEYWVVNRAWWREADPIPERPELQFWRVEAVAGRTNRVSQPHGTYELRRDAADGAWTLLQIAD